MRRSLWKHHFKIEKAKVNVDSDKLHRWDKSFSEVKLDGFYILKMQSEVVTSLPPDAEKICSSESSEFEVYMVKDRILAFEGHPEFSEPFLEKHVVKRLYDTLIINEEYKNEILLQLHDEEKSLDRRRILQMCKMFLKS